MFVKGKANHRTAGTAIWASYFQKHFLLIIYKTADRNGSAPS